MLPSRGLFLLPNLLDPTHSSRDFFAPLVLEVVSMLTGLIAESEKEGRRFLRRFAYEEGRSFRDIPIEILNEHSTRVDLASLKHLLKKGGKWGLVADVGLPTLADPGADLVFSCHAEKIPVYPLPGTSSIFYALMLSGFSAQNFAFQGYLPRKERLLWQKIKEIEKAACEQKQTQIFIEAPYRTIKVIKTLLTRLKPSTYLAVAWNLTSATEGILVQSIAQWKRDPIPVPEKALAVFLLALPSRSAKN